eukprot:gnl/MRDRNA2_/MRDRNA2_93415_c0_seq1.p1 gnl/MRDRNA2_/MRDRNA2_93415_c0~~gnl/MRDRNA2_/MRDRNA2_93415_c0_seq1.p1  ORF type:complete len:336 (+),score=53.43 gnl/MRDRNA2_/MRDRNA2_93415_c0_seq1:82-1089(+)
MPAPRVINPVYWSNVREDVGEGNCGKRRCSLDSGSCTSSGRAPFATEADRAVPPSPPQTSGGKGKAPVLGEGGGYAGVNASRLAQIHDQVGDLPDGGRVIKKRIDGTNAVSDARAAEDTRFFQEGHKVGRRQQPENQKYYVDPKVREKYRYYIANSGDGESDRIPGTKRHASQPKAGARDIQKPALANDVPSGHAGTPNRPASACGGYGQPRSETSRRSKSSVASSAVSEQSFSGYSGSIVESAASHNPFGRRKNSVCSSRSSQAPSETSYRTSRAASDTSRRSSRTDSTRNTQHRDKVKFNPPPRSCSSVATSASGWSQMSSENASSLYSGSFA